MALNPPDNDAEYYDLCGARFDHDVAAVADRDTALLTDQRITVHKKRAPQGLERDVFNWHKLKFDDDDKDLKEELKGDLHGGQLHRQNRMARGEVSQEVYGWGQGGGGGRGGRGGKRGGKKGESGRLEWVCAVRMPGLEGPPMARGVQAEWTKDMFWNEPIVEPVEEVTSGFSRLSIRG